MKYYSSYCLVILSDNEGNVGNYLEMSQKRCIFATKEKEQT